MKKTAIIAVLLLSTGLTALSISRKNDKADLKSERSVLTIKSEAVASSAALATAD